MEIRCNVAQINPVKVIRNVLPHDVPTSRRPSNDVSTLVGKAVHRKLMSQTSAAARRGKKNEYVCRPITRFFFVLDSKAV
jgi:hypothetical protein